MREILREIQSTISHILLTKLVLPHNLLEMADQDNSRKRKLYDEKYRAKKKDLIKAKRKERYQLKKLRLLSHGMSN